MVAISAAVRKHLTDINEWQKLGEANIFPPDSHLELIEGEILEMAPIGFNHAGHLMRLINYFAATVQGKAIVNAQNPLLLNNYSEPQPDFLLLRPEDSFYTTRHPTATDVLLLVEIADSSLSYDQTRKLRLYAKHQIPEYWIINLNQPCLEVYREPIEDNYAQKTTLRANERLSLLQLPDVTVEVSELLSHPA